MKGNPGTTPATPSTYFAWCVINGKVSSKALISQIPDLLVNFGGNFVSDNILAKLYAPRFDTVYAPDSGAGVFTTIDPQTGAIKGQLSYGAAEVGDPLDVAVDRTSLYVLTKSASIAVIGLEGSDSGKVPSLVQNLEISEGGSKKAFQVLATYPS
ncbi:hypothetical protein MMC18_009049 [Xylographa bjoerkii]|nr:hypothetical protein [Xylographa bjoerkii]